MIAISTSSTCRTLELLSFLGTVTLQLALMNPKRSLRITYAYVLELCPCIISSGTQVRFACVKKIKSQDSPN